jgi:hypothetical protein
MKNKNKGRDISCVQTEIFILVISKITSYQERAHIFTMKGPITKGISKTEENMVSESNSKPMVTITKEVMPTD